MAHRFLISPKAWAAQTVELDEGELYHARRVLRMNPGDMVVVFDGEGREAEARVEILRRGQGLLRLLTPPTELTTDRIKIILGQGLPKARKIEDILEDATELGVTGFYPLNCERSVVRVHPDKVLARVERWTRIAGSAAKQCARADIPEVHPPTSVADFLKAAQEVEGAMIIMAWEESSRQKDDDRPTLPELFAQDAPGTLFLMVGPEGGFTEEEAKLAQESGAHIVSLGPRILRTETAGPTFVALAQFAWGDLS